MRSLAVILIVVVCFPAAARAEPKMTEEVKKATARGLAFLKDRQNADGSWSDGRYLHNTAITSFALMAFLSQGQMPHQGLYGPEVAKAARFLMAAAQMHTVPDIGDKDKKKKIEAAYIIGARGGNMYCHAMATLALAELWGNTGDDEIRPILKKATDLIIHSQCIKETKDRGGWRYEPTGSGADISVTIMQVMALRAAKNAGIDVPQQTLKLAIEYIDRCWTGTGFAYQPGKSPGFARTAAGVCVLYLASDWKDLVDEKKLKQIRSAVDYLHRHFDQPHHFWYGHYYAAHAMHRVGGKDWESWYARLVDRFLKRQPQGPDGSWPGGEVGPVYHTSIAVIVLSAPMHYLPIFQR
jgi:hypothetical protein